MEQKQECPEPGVAGYRADACRDDGGGRHVDLQNNPVTDEKQVIRGLTWRVDRFLSVQIIALAEVSRDG